MTETLLLILVNLIITLSVSITSGVLGWFLAIIVPPVFLGKEHFAGLGGLQFMVLAVLVSFVFILLSFVISYLLSLRLSRYLREKRGWEIRHPRKIFLFSVLILLSPILFLVFLALLSNTRVSP